MTHLEKSLMITGQLIGLHDQAKRLYGDKYKAQVRPFKALLRRLMLHYETDSPIKAILRDRDDGGGDPPLLMLAAIYEVSGGNE